MRKLLKIVAAAGLILAVTGTAGATSVGYTVSGWGPTHFPGTAADDPAPAPPDTAHWGPAGYPGDEVELELYSDTIDLYDGASYVKKINTLLWTGFYTYAGGGDPENPDADWRELAFHFSTPRTITIGTESTPLSQGGLLECNWDTDHLSFSDGPMVSLIVESYKVDITPLGLPAAGAGWSGDIGEGVVQPSRDIEARLDVTLIPEPLTMLGVFLGVSGLGGYLKRRLA